MDTSLYDPDLDGVPPIVGAGRPVGGSGPKAALVGKKFAVALREHPFVEWVLGLSLPGLVAVSIAIGVLVSTAIAIALAGEGGAFLVPLPLLLPAAILWALRNCRIVLPQFFFAKLTVPRWVVVRPRSRPVVRPSLPPFVGPASDADPRFRWLTESISRRVLWCVSIPFLMYANLVATVLGLVGLAWIPHLLGERYGTPEPGSIPLFLFMFVVVLYSFGLFVVGAIWVVVSDLGMMIYIVGAGFWTLLGPLAAIRSLAREGWSGWGRPISVVFDPMIRLSLFAIDLTGSVARLGCRTAWRLIGWEPAGPSKSDPEDEFFDAIYAPSKEDGGSGARPLSLPRLTDSARGRVLAILTFLVFVAGANALVSITCWIGVIFRHSRGQLASNPFRALESIVVGLLLLGLFLKLLYFLIGVRGPRVPSRRRGKSGPVIP